MNEVDFVIILIVGISAFHGVRHGVLSGAIDLAALILALAIGASSWRLLAAPLLWFGFPAPLAGMLGFILTTIGVAFGANHLLIWMVRNIRPPKWLEQTGGGVMGFLTGLLLSSFLLIFSGAMPQAYKAIPRSLLGMRLLSIVPAIHGDLEAVGIPLPKLVMLPTNYREELAGKGMRQGLQFLQINFTRLDGSKCIKCEHRVHFLGYKFPRGTLLSPKFQCPYCGRTSDGCQTFEGFHKIYGQCPVDIARQGVWFDCGVWTNGNFVLPHGKCPIDGKELTPAELRQEPPQPGE
jgi:hypothetical protein